MNASSRLASVLVLLTLPLAVTGQASAELTDAAKLAGVALPVPPASRPNLQRVKYNNPGLVVDLGVGWAWPIRSTWTTTAT